MSDALQQRPAILVVHGLKPLDALHVAAAEAPGAEYFLTCDDRLARHYPAHHPVLQLAAEKQQGQLGVELEPGQKKGRRPIRLACSASPPQTPDQAGHIGVP